MQPVIPIEMVQGAVQLAVFLVTLIVTVGGGTAFGTELKPNALSNLNGWVPGQLPLSAARADKAPAAPTVNRNNTIAILRRCDAVEPSVRGDG